MQGFVVTLLLMSVKCAAWMLAQYDVVVYCIGACAFFVRHLKCIKIISFHVSVPVRLHVSSPKQILH
jgi:hypothetical protein